MERQKAKSKATADFATPSGILNILTNLDPKLAKPIIAGLAVLAAAAIFSTWKVDIKTAATFGFWILGFGLLLFLISFIETNKSLKKLLSWFLAGFLMLTMSLMLVSAAFPGETPLPPIYCMVRVLEYCGAVAKSVSTTLPGTVGQIPQAPSDDKRVSQFELQLKNPSYEEGGKRYWIWANNHWEERYPSGKADIFINPTRLTLDSCPGTIVVRQANGDKIFIPDKGCSTMIVRWQRGTSEWNYLGQMRDII